MEARRRRAVKLISEGWRVTDVAETLGVSRQAVSKWKRVAAKQGARAKALAAKKQHVPQSRLSKADRQALVRLLRGGPRKAGFQTDLWTTSLVKQLIEREFGVTYHPGHVGRMLHALGFSCQKPERRSREQDTKQVRKWREQEWPRIKKGGSQPS